jgi:hypothetical protein
MGNSRQVQGAVRLEGDTPYKAFSGAQIQAVINDKAVGSLQACTVSVTREVAAIYGMGSADPRTFVKGKRGIAGTLVFSQFDRHAVLFDVFDGLHGQNMNSGRMDLVTSRFARMTQDQGLLSQKPISSSNWSSDQTISNSLKNFGSPIADDLAQMLKSVYGMVGAHKLRYADQIPEFDITLTMVDESGAASFCVIGGITLVNEGFGFSLDDLTSETAYTYVARYITPLTSITQGRNFERTRIA